MFRPVQPLLGPLTCTDLTPPLPPFVCKHACFDCQKHPETLRTISCLGVEQQHSLPPNASKNSGFGYTASGKAAYFHMWFACASDKSQLSTSQDIVQSKKTRHTVTASLSHPPVPELPSICTLTGTGGVHSTLRYLMSMRPFSMGATCTHHKFSNCCNSGTVTASVLASGSLLHSNSAKQLLGSRSRDSQLCAQ